MPEITQVFLSVWDNPDSFTLNSLAMSSFERLCVIMYSKSCSSQTLNDARLKLFSNGTKTVETLPPTSAAYFQQVRRCILQACYLWKQPFFLCKLSLIMGGESMRTKSNNGYRSGPHALMPFPICVYVQCIDRINKYRYIIPDQTIHIT